MVLAEIQTYKIKILESEPLPSPSLKITECMKCKYAGHKMSPDTGCMLNIGPELAFKLFVMSQVMHIGPAS